MLNSAGAARHLCITSCSSSLLHAVPSHTDGTVPSVTIATALQWWHKDAAPGGHAAHGLPAALGEVCQGNHHVNMCGAALWGVPLTAALFCHSRHTIGNDIHYNVFILLDLIRNTQL